MKYINIKILIIILFCIIIYFLYYNLSLYFFYRFFYNSIQLIIINPSEIILNFPISRENFKNNIKKDIQIIISRYNEDLDWLKHELFNKYKILLYNKGNNDNFYKSPNMKIINLKNVGRESHTYLYHIIENYDKLSEITIFLPGSTNMNHKKERAHKIINELNNINNTIFLCEPHKENIKKTHNDFQIDNYSSTEEKNKNINPETKLLLSKIRPFGKWYENHFGNIDVYCISFYGILCIHKKHIIQHSKSYYEKFIKELENHSNPEVGHYFERSWNAIFHPIDDAKIINL